MKAIEINGEIKVYNSLPNSWKGVMGNFSKLSDEEIKSYGFYDVVTPDYNSRTQELSNIFWDENNEVFTYTVNDIEFSQTVEELKEMQINDLKKRLNLKLEETDWYILRKAERNIDIPSEITTERNNLFAELETKENEINALTNKADIITYGS
jgi:hypothetical protein|tara:strand:+ start:1879 stop:2337 length:459 start_codon:yes stop_codon:yes gene_type:complete